MVRKISFKTKTRKQGNSLIATIPKTLRDVIGIVDEDIINWEWSSDDPEHLTISLADDE